MFYSFWKLSLRWCKSHHYGKSHPVLSHNSIWGTRVVEIMLLSWTLAKLLSLVRNDSIGSGKTSCLADCNRLRRIIYYPDWLGGGTTDYWWVFRTSHCLHIRPDIHKRVRMRHSVPRRYFPLSSESSSFSTVGIFCILRWRQNVDCRKSRERTK